MPGNRAEIPLVNRRGGIYHWLMAYEFKVIRRVEFSDTDMAGIMHYSNFFRFMETAEHAFFRSLGFSIVMGKVDPPLGWPRVRAECDFKAPLFFEDEVEIQLLVSEKRSKSLSYIFKMLKLNAEPPVEVARGGLTVVCVRHDGGKMTACTIPKAVADQIQVAPGEMLQ
jgi:acyl-CoA thioester hydrolase